MNDAFLTPLELLTPDSSQTGARPRVFLKREDLLPFGGGNKVRRLLAWIDDLQDVREIETVAVLSYRGSHTFLTLAELLRRGLLPVRTLLFWETNRPANAYTEQIRRRYADQPGITIVGGGAARLLARMYLTSWSSRRTLVLPIGGSIAPRREPYCAPLDQCAAQLAAAGHAGRVWHLLPASSGTMLSGLERSIREAGYEHHRLIGVLTGPLAARCALAARNRRPARILLVRPRPLSWTEYLTEANRFFSRTGVWLDPTHMIYAAQALDRLPAAVQPEDAVVCWITGPRVENLGGIGTIP